MDEQSLDLEDQFKIYLHRCGIDPEKISHEQYIETKRAFFAGCGQTLVLLADVIGRMDEDKATLQVSDLLNQCQIFWNNQMGQRAGL